MLKKDKLFDVAHVNAKPKDVNNFVFIVMFSFVYGRFFIFSIFHVQVIFG